MKKTIFPQEYKIVIKTEEEGELEMENMEIFLKNLNFFEVSLNLNQKQMADRLYASPPQYNKVRTGRQLPSLGFLLNAEKTFGVTIDELLHVDLQDDIEDNHEYEQMDSRYVGTYVVYYCSSDLYSKYFFVVDNPSVEVKAGLLMIYKKESEKVLKACLWTGLSKERASVHFHELKKLGNGVMNMRTYMSSVGKECDSFEGNVFFSKKHIQIDLTEKQGGKALLTFHRTEGVKFNAALGTSSMLQAGDVSSLSYIGLCDFPLQCTNEEISKYLVMQDRKMLDFPLIHNYVGEIVKKCEQVENVSVRHFMASSELYNLIIKILISEKSKPTGVTKPENALYCNFVEKERRAYRDKKSA